MATNPWGAGINLVGNTGTPGSQIYFGTGTPPSTTGIAGDVFFATDTSYIYQKTSSGWPSTGKLLMGAAGLMGSNGSSFHASASNPQSTDGANGDFWVNWTTGEAFGPKASGSWPDTGYSIKGPTGATGAQGVNLLNGSGAPASSLGNIGDAYIDTTNSILYAAKTSSGWASTGASLVGQQGVQGVQGIQGTQGVRGSYIFTGSGAPTASSFANAMNGDLYFDTVGRTLYSYSSN